jgi:hypothetical protein
VAVVPAVPALQGRARLNDSRSIAAGTWRETLLLTPVLGVLTALLSAPAFRTSFFAEAFVYVGSYREHGSYWTAVFSPHGHAFFRPTLWALNIPWNLLLPPSPLAYHLRNAAFVVLELALFHRLLVRLVWRPAARAAALAIVAVSRVHFTTIGYVASFSTILVTLLTLGALLLVVRDAERPSSRDRLAALVLVALVVFSKDYGMAIAALLPAAWIAAPGRPHLQPAAWLRRWGAPVAITIALYVGLRVALVPPLPGSSPYAPVFDPALVAARVVRAFGSLANLSLTSARNVVGEPGLASLAGDAHAGRIEIALALAFVGLLAATLLVARVPRSAFALPAVWGAVYFAPTLLSRNEQMFYLNDLVFAFALLVGLCLDRLGRGWLVAWIVFVSLSAANAAIGNELSRRLASQDWVYTASRTEPVLDAAKRLRGRGVKTLAAVTGDPVLFEFALTADGLGPMLPELVHDPELTVFVAPRESVLPAESGDPGTVFLDADASFAEMRVRWKSQAPAPVVNATSGVVTPTGDLKLIRLYPERIAAGASFNVQPGGWSSLVLEVEGARPRTVVRIDGRAYPSVYGGAQLSIRVPPDLTATPARHRVQLVDDERASNVLDLTVTP